ncbi:hypothetical protein HN803_00010 [candidate division WWE3 bacterium]|nr:hypothetical protein [candidate division WWE3 bacterium]
MAKKKQLPKYQDGERYLKNPFVRRKPMRVKDLDSYEKNQYGTLEDDRFYLESFPPPRRDASGKYYHPVIRDPETGELTRVHNLPITSISGRKASDSSEMAMDTKTGKMTSNTHNVDWSKSQAGNKLITTAIFAAATPASMGLKATSKLGKAGVKTLDALINPGMARKPMISWRSLKPKSRYVKAKQLVDAKLEGEQWVKDWYDDPYTKNRIKNIEMPEIQSPIFDNELSKVEFATNPDFIGSSNFSGEEVLNRGRSFNNGEVYVNPNIPRNQIRSTTIHELTHNKTRNESNYVIDVLVKRAMDKSKAASDYDNYLLDPAEVYARIAQIRFTHNIKPSDIVSDKQIDKIIKSNKGLVDDRFFKLIKDKSAFKDLFNLLPAVAGTGAVGIGAAQAGNKEYQQGGVITDPRGQWAHPGKVTKIPSSDITMQGVNYPVLGVSDSGDRQMMYPGGNYHFKGKSVTEYPIMQQGGQYKPIITNDPNDPRLKAYQDSAAVYNDWARLYNENTARFGSGRNTDLGVSNECFADYADDLGDNVDSPFTMGEHHGRAEQVISSDIAPQGQTMFRNGRRLWNARSQQIYDYSNARPTTPIRFQPSASSTTSPMPSNSYVDPKMQRAANNPISTLQTKGQPAMGSKVGIHKWNDPSLGILGKDVSYFSKEKMLEAKKKLTESGLSFSGKDDKYYATRYREPVSRWEDGELIRKDGKKQPVYFQQGGQVDRSRDAMIKARMAMDSHFGNSMARRMTNDDPRGYTFTGEEGVGIDKGRQGNVYVSSYDKLATPQIQDVNGKLEFISNPWSPENADRSYEQSMKFESPEDAQYFGENYKRFAPMMKKNWQEQNNDNDMKKKIYQKGGAFKNTYARPTAGYSSKHGPYVGGEAYYMGNGAIPFLKGRLGRDGSEVSAGSQFMTGAPVSPVLQVSGGYNSNDGPFFGTKAGLNVGGGQNQFRVGVENRINKNALNEFGPFVGVRLGSGNFSGNATAGYNLFNKSPQFDAGLNYTIPLNKRERSRNSCGAGSFRCGGQLPKYTIGGPFTGKDYIGDMSQYGYDTGIWNGTDQGGSYGNNNNPLGDYSMTMNEPTGGMSMNRFSPGPKATNIAGGIGMAAGVAGQMIPDRESNLNKQLNSADGKFNDWAGAAGKGALSAAGAVTPLALNPAILAATGGISAAAIPIAGAIGGISKGIKANKEARAEDQETQKYFDAMEKQSLAYQPRGTRMYKQGGQAMANPNAELEQQEGVQTPDGETFNVNGAPHEQGGIDVALEQGSKIFSDDESMALPDGRTPAQVFKQLSKKLEFYKDKLESGATLAKQTAKAMISSIEKKIDELFQYQEQMKQSQGGDIEGQEEEIMGQEGNYYPETENVPPEAIYQEGGIGPLSPWEIQKLKGTYLKEPKDRENHAIQSFKSTYETETGKKMTSTQEAKLREEYLTNGTARGELTGTEETYLFPTQPYMSETRTSHASKINPSNRDVYTPEEWSVAAKETGDYRLKEYNDAVKKHITSPTSSPYFKRGGKLPKYQQGDIYTSEDERLNKIARNAISRSTNPYYTGLSGNYTILKDPTWPPAATQQQGIDLSTPRGYRPQGVGGGNNAFIAEDQIGDGYQVPGDPPKVPPYLANIAPYFGGQQQASGGIDPRIITENGQMRLYANTGTEGEDLRQLAIDTWGDVGAKTNIQGEDLYYYPTGAGETEVAGTKKKSTQLAKNKYVPTTADATTEQPMEHGVPVSDKPLSELTAGLSANLRQTGNPAIPLGEKIPFTGTPSTEMGDNQFDWKSLIPYASRIPGMVNALRKMKVPEAEQAKQIAYKDQVFDPYPIQAAAQTAKDAVSANSNYAPVTRGIQLGLEGQKQKSLNEGQAGVNKLNFVGRNQVNQSNQRTDMFNTQARNTKNMTQFAADQQRLQNIDMATRDVGDIYMKQQFEKAVMERDVTSIRLYTDSLIKNGATWEKIRPSLVGMLDDDVLREYDAKYKDK